MIALPGFCFIAKRTGQLVHGMLLRMNPGNQLGVRVLAPTDNAGRRAFQIRDFHVIMLLDTQLVELLRR